ncbi:hypothetical protein [Acidovorax sp. CCYZU-2555]|uniref:hypothetical protein n=1 Tax=Acidovorax sp. CCYZU-2555 TaxID=2835042 RepID=UPI001BCC990F|nr:hypothetical protein [Acidovorax sp. CCYZU-2555]MBS7776399.1 hypothetical protein [Acidovorax sp. CCYZU-2555]
MRVGGFFFWRSIAVIARSARHEIRIEIEMVAVFCAHFYDQLSLKAADEGRQASIAPIRSGQEHMVLYVALT